MSADPKPADPAIPPETRARWHEFISQQIMLAAGRLNLVPYGETDMAKLPPNVSTVAIRLRDDLRKRACIREAKAGSHHPRIGQMVVAELWNALKPFAARGEFYVEHLVGDAKTQREARVRLSAGE